MFCAARPATHLPTCLPAAASSFRQSVQRNAVLDLPAGAASMPLPLSAGLPNHTLSFRCVPPAAFAAAAAAESLLLWSRPITVQVGVDSEMHVVVPVIPAEVGEAEGAGGGGAHGGGSGGGDSAHLTAAAAGSPDAAHLTPTAAAAGTAAARGLSGGAGPGGAPAVAILRLSVHRRGQGTMHVVLESMHSDPPYLLENRTPFPLQYRQVRCPCCSDARYAPDAVSRCCTPG